MLTVDTALAQLLVVFVERIEGQNCDEIIPVKGDSFLLCFLLLHEVISLQCISIPLGIVNTSLFLNIKFL